MDTPKYVPPSDRLVADVVARLDADALERWNERAGIIEFSCPGTSRGHAEALALIDLLRQQTWWLTGLLAIEIELDGATQWVLTCDPVAARHYFADIGADEVAVLNPADVVHQQYGDVAMLTTVG